jgi:hypothetical protein
MGDFCGLAEHDRCRAIFLGRQLDRPFDRGRVETTTGELAGKKRGEEAGRVSKENQK